MSDNLIISLGLSTQSDLVTAVLAHLLISFCPSMAVAALIEVIFEFLASLLTISSIFTASTVSFEITSATSVRSKSG